MIAYEVVDGETVPVLYCDTCGQEVGGETGIEYAEILGSIICTECIGMEDVFMRKVDFD